MTHKTIIWTLLLVCLFQIQIILAQHRPRPKACTSPNDCKFGAICLSGRRNPAKKFCQCPRKCHNFQQKMVLLLGGV